MRHVVFVLIVVSLIIRNSLAQSAPQGTKPILTWEDYGCRPNDPTFDNGPVLSRMIADQAARKLKTAPVGTLADYYIKTPINWPGVYGCALEGSGGYAFAVTLQNIGCTRIIWNGPAGGTMLNYRGCGGRIGRLMLCGVDWRKPEAFAGTAIMVEARVEPPAGNLVTDQLAITQCDTGIHCLATPDNNHADQMKHFGLLFHGVKTCYWVEGEQSCPHDFYSVDIRNGWETAFKFDKDGALHVYGCYVGGDLSGKLQTLLYIGRANTNNCYYDIQGLQPDNSIKNLRLLDHGKWCGIVSFAGLVPWPRTLADPYIYAREGPTPNAWITSSIANAPWPRPPAAK